MFVCTPVGQQVDNPGAGIRNSAREHESKPIPALSTACSGIGHVISGPGKPQQKDNPLQIGATNSNFHPQC